MAKKKKPKQHRSDYKSKHELLRQQWTHRLAISAVYLLFWTVSILWLRWNFPNPIRAEYFAANSHSLLFINIGLATIFIVIQLELSKRFKQANSEQ